MEKQTKNIITRKIVEKELAFINKADIRSALLLGGALALFFIPLSVFFVCVLTSEEDGLLSNLLAVLFGVIFLIPVFIPLRSLPKSFLNKKLLKNGEFEITKRVLLHKSEKVVGRHTEEFLYFEGFKEVAAGSAAYQLAAHGDEFYIVHYKNQDTIVLLYPAKIYGYKDIKI